MQQMFISKMCFGKKQLDLMTHNYYYYFYYYY